MPRIFDPHAGDGSILVATIQTTQDATIAARRRKDWQDELDAYRNEREIRSLMHQRTGVCG